MGLELVELVLEVEEMFGIVVSDNAATQFRTVGQLYEYILEARRQERQVGCSTGRVFLQIRRVLTATTSTPRRAIRPSADLQVLLPPRIRRRVWSRLRQDVSGRLRGLRLPYRLGPTIAWLCVVMGVAGSAVITPDVGIGNAIVLGMTVTVVTLLLFQFASRPLAVAFPRGVVTVGDLAVAALPPGFEDAAKQQMTRPGGMGEVAEDRGRLHRREDREGHSLDPIR
jgi:hypothetical protein